MQNIDFKKLKKENVLEGLIKSSNRNSNKKLKNVNNHKNETYYLNEKKLIEEVKIWYNKNLILNNNLNNLKNEYFVVKNDIFKLENILQNISLILNNTLNEIKNNKLNLNIVLKDLDDIFNKNSIIFNKIGINFKLLNDKFNTPEKENKNSTQINFNFTFQDTMNEISNQKKWSSNKFYNNLPNIKELKLNKEIIIYQSNTNFNPTEDRYLKSVKNQKLIFLEDKNNGYYWCKNLENNKIGLIPKIFLKKIN